MRKLGLREVTSLPKEGGRQWDLEPGLGETLGGLWVHRLLGLS